jgi:hypothetical protein
MRLINGIKVGQNPGFSDEVTIGGLSKEADGQVVLGDPRAGSGRQKEEGRPLRLRQQGRGYHGLDQGKGEYQTHLRQQKWPFAVEDEFKASGVLRERINERS